MLSLIQTQTQVKPGLAQPVTVKAFDNHRGEWALEVIFSPGGQKVIVPSSCEEAAGIERDLREKGWRVSASLNNGGWNARRICVKCQFGDHCGNCPCCRGS